MKIATLPSPSLYSTSHPCASASSRHFCTDFMIRPCALNCRKGITSIGVEYSKSGILKSSGSIAFDPVQPIPPRLRCHTSITLSLLTPRSPSVLVFLRPLTALPPGATR